MYLSHYSGIDILFSLSILQVLGQQLLYIISLGRRAVGDGAGFAI